MPHVAFLRDWSYAERGVQVTHYKKQQTRIVSEECARIGYNLGALAYMNGKTGPRIAWSVPRMWDGQTVFCIAGGPSLTEAQCNSIRGRGPAIGVNDAYRIAPWIDMLYACDGGWWDIHAGVPDYHGIKITQHEKSAMKYRLRWLRTTGKMGISTDPSTIKSGRNSGYQALNIAVHTGARRIVLLGYDMRANGKTHWFGDHPAGLQKSSPFQGFIQCFESAVAPLRELGVEVVNCSPGSALKCFEQRELSEVLDGIA